MRKNRLKSVLPHLVVSLLILTSLSVYYSPLGIAIREVEASQSVSVNWYYSGWQYRKEHNIIMGANVTGDPLFYDVSNSWTTIQGNPAERHNFQPVHNTAIMEVNKVVDGATRKYLAYDSDPDGLEIRLYFTNDIDGSWTAYSGNPILGSSSYLYRWPSVAYVNGTFHMFLTDRTSNTIERWTSTDGINFNFQENVQSGTTGENTKNPFIWLNPNDNKWYLYWHDARGAQRDLYVRNATNIEDLDAANDTTILSRSIPFGGPSIMYYNNQYWLLAEILQYGKWKTAAYYSTTSPSSGFIECDNSPILSDDECCPMLLLNPNQTRAYLFTTRDSSRWYQDTREVYINKTEAPDLLDYQIRIMAYYGSGTDSGEKVYLNGHPRTDFGDVRFTWFNSSSGLEVGCDYWIEELKMSESALFWVKVPKISGKGNSTIYIYYGKSDTATTSNGNNTFDFFDDFSGTLSKWVVIDGTWQIENGELSSQTTTFGQRIRASGFTFGNHSVHVKIKWISGSYFESAIEVRGQSPSEQSDGYFTFLSAYPYLDRYRIAKMSGGSETTIEGTGATNPSKDFWYNCVFKLYGNTLKGSVDPLYSTQIAGTDSAFRSGTLCLLHWSMYAEHVHYDDLFVCKYFDPEPAHGNWGSEETGEYVLIDQTFVSDERADIGSIQTIGFHAKWNNIGSDVVGGNIYVNGTNYVTNSTGWVAFNVNSPLVGKDIWIVTEVNCSGITMYMQTAQPPSIIWDRIKITEGETTKESLTLGETATIWFKAIYEYDNTAFTSTNGTLYLNGSPMTWSATNTRWEYTYTATSAGTATFTISEVYDSSQGLTTINDTVGTQTITVWSTPFSIITNSTISELTFNSTSKTITYIVSGPTGTIGHTNVTIVKTLIEDINDLKVYIDGNEINYTIIDTVSSWLIHFTYTHSTHKVIMETGSLHTNASYALLPYSAIIFIIVVILLVRKRITRKIR